MNFSSGAGQRGKLDKQTDRKCDENRRNSRESPALSRPSLRTNKHRTGVTANTAALLPHHSWTGWVDVTVWASGPDFSSSAASSGPQQLLKGQFYFVVVFPEEVVDVGERLKNYVVLIRPSSFLMAAERGENREEGLNLQHRFDWKLIP